MALRLIARSCVYEDMSLQLPLTHSGQWVEDTRAYDAAIFAAGARQRFWAIVVITGVLLIGLAAGVAQASALSIVGLFGSSITVNWLLDVIAKSHQLYRWWLKYAFMMLDIGLVSFLVYLFPDPVFAMAYLLVIVPWSFDSHPKTGYLAVAVSVIGFGLACTHFGSGLPVGVSPTEAVLAAVLLLVVGLQLVPIPARIAKRIRRARGRMELIEQGDLTVRTDGRHADELGALERSVNRVLDELGGLIGTVQQEAGELSLVVTDLSRSVSTLRGSSAVLTSDSEELRGSLQAQRERAIEGVKTGQQARETAESARRTAEITAADAHALDDVALRSREAIDRASQALVSVGREVGDAARKVRALSPASEQVGEFVHTVSRIARQTNLLALNAAIEASRAGDDGQGFAVVAEEIRALAIESAQAAKRVAGVMQKVQGDIGSAVKAMDATAEQVDGAGTIARDATRALASIVDGIGRIAKQSDEVSALAGLQCDLSTSSATAFEVLDSTTLGAADRARSTAESASAQQKEYALLSHAADQLSLSAERLRAVSNWRVL